MQSLFDAEWAPGRSNYWKTSLMRAPDDSAIETMLAHARMFPTPACAIYLQQLHGAAARIGPADTAFPHRFYHYDCGPWATWEDPADTDRCIAWARDCWQALRPFYAPGAYVNAVDYPATDDDDRIRSAYGQNYDRLRTLKTRYDPANRFRLNANIPPG
jgi:FAD/FMN-containing dehydrogenase